jgi:protease-4
MKQSTFGCLLAIVLLALVVSLFVNVLQFSAGMGGADGLAGGMGVKKRERLAEEVFVPGKGAEKIVQIDLEGIISSVGSGGLFGVGLSSVESLKHQLEQAGEDEKVKAVVLRVNSPGGEVTASDTLYAAVKKLSGSKPVVVYMDSIAASGGYYIACGASKVVASETTLTGSIGVIIDMLNYTELFDKVGLKANTFVSGAFKDSLSGSRPMREEEKAYVQNLVSQMYERFLGVVSEARGVPKDVLRNGVADGRVVTGREALEAKLVDQIGYIEDAYQLAGELGKSEKATVVKYHRQVGFMDLFSASSARAVSSGEPMKVEIGSGMLPALKPGLPYYLAPLSLPLR